MHHIFRTNPGGLRHRDAVLKGLNDRTLQSTLQIISSDGLPLLFGGVQLLAFKTGSLSLLDGLA